jgi:iron-sulfur cluster assembly protein
MITVSDKARHEVKRIVEEQNLGDVYLRVGVRGGGCSGFSYTLGFDDKKTELDMQYEDVICDPKSFLYLNGTEVDFEESLMGRGFKFINPNASKSCGCGESFSV